MYIFTNAFKTISRNMSRNVLIGIIIFIIGLASVIALCINTAATDIVDNKVETSSVEVSFELNMDSMREDIMGRLEEDSESDKSLTETLSIEEIEEYANSLYVKEYYNQNSVGLNSSSITVASTENMLDRFMEGEETSSAMPMESSGMQSSSGRTQIGGFNVTTSDFTLEGYSSLNAMSNFIDGTYQITEGDVFEDFDTATYTVIINEELAEENDVTVGDVITLTNPSDEEETFEVTIVAIYTDNEEITDTTSMFSNSVNTIITNTATVEAIVEDSEDEYKLELTNTPTIILNSLEVIEDYTDEVEDKGLNEMYEVVSNEDEIMSSLEALENLQSFSNTFLILVLIIGSVILLVLNMINIRERKYEIGVLRAIGMKKHLVGMQFVIETFIVTLAAIVIAMIIGSLISVPISSAMLAGEIESLEETSESIDSNFGMQSGMSGGSTGMSTPGTSISNLGVQSDNYIDNINAAINVTVVLQMIGISILITVISSIISIIIIARYNPLTILSSRS